MRRMFVPALALCAAASLARADGLPDGRGVAAVDRSSFATEIRPAGDADDYVIAAYRGTTLTATLKPPRFGLANPVVEFLRPGGGVVQEAEGFALTTKRGALTARFVVDASGTWKVRVRGDEDSTGAYKLTLHAPPPGRSVLAAGAPDANGQVRFVVPARGGASMSWTLRWQGPAPALNTLFDPRGEIVAGAPGESVVKRFVLPEDLPSGDFALVFDVDAATTAFTLAYDVKLPKTRAGKTAKLSADEPFLMTTGVAPDSGPAGTRLVVRGGRFEDPLARRGASVGLLLGARALADVVYDPATGAVSGTVPEGTALGLHDVVVTSTTGQPAVRADGFEVVAPPIVVSFSPPVGSVLGGTEITIRGSGFRSPLGLLIDGIVQPVNASFVDATTARFPIPPHNEGAFSVGVRDLRSQRDGVLDDPVFSYQSMPAIAALVPPIASILGGEEIRIEGFLFEPSDRVYLELATPGDFEEISLSETYVNANLHRFVAPIRPRGTYRIYVQDAEGKPAVPTPVPLTYFSFADATASSGLGDAPAATSALLDLDGDGDLDLALAQRGGDTASATSLTRIHRNDGAGGFTDVTADVMPAAGADDWRADRIVAADLDQDGRADLVLTTNSTAVPAANASHTRILMNEARGGQGADATMRVLRDRTGDLMAPVRTMRRFSWPGTGESYVSDDWRGLDLWVGDLDGDGEGPPAIVLTHAEGKDDSNTNPSPFQSGVHCGNYCASAYSNGYPYAFYWGGSRAFTWDAAARGGLGRFKFDANYFPRRSGMLFSLSAAPSGVRPPPCSATYNSICKGLFTPFTGKRVAVGDFDADGKPDVAVVSDETVQRRFTHSGPLTAISALQVARAGFDPTAGARITDLTAKFTGLGLWLEGDAVAIGAGVLAWARADAGTGRALRLFRVATDEFGSTVEDVSDSLLPAPAASDALEAAALAFRDLEGDGDEDLVLVASAGLGGAGSAFRILRNESTNGGQGPFRRAWDSLIAQGSPPGDALDGVALAVGDVTGDGLLEFLVSREAAGGADPATRVLGMQK